jgi:hypothetical protein
MKEVLSFRIIGEKEGICPSEATVSFPLGLQANPFGVLFISVYLKKL